ncbi:MAG TPA: type II toxin-antitoxin system RelE/ParE family toxin [Candidatus Cryosericum sp.]
MKKKFKSISWAMDELAAMPPSLRGAVYSLVGVLEEKGTLVYPDGGIVDGNARIFEIRAHFHNQEARVLYYYWDEGDLIYGLVAFIKKTQKTPPDKIKLAQKRLRQLKRDLKGW